MKKIKFIYNPFSGGAVIPACLDQIIDFYQRHGYSLVPYRMDFKGNETDIISDLKTPGYESILVSGGDGSINFIVNLLKKNDIDIPVGVLPSGTANDFATMLGFDSTDVLGNCHRLISGEVRTIDLGVANGEYFVNIFSCGLLTDISQRTPTSLKNTFGKLAYYIGSVGELARFHKMNLRISTDAGSYEGGCAIFFVFNGKTAGNFKIAFKSEPDDGLLDVLILKWNNVFSTIQTLLKYVVHFGEHKEYPSGEVHIKCSRLRAECDKDENTDIDGQPGPGFPLDIICEPSAQKVIFPGNPK